MNKRYQIDRRGKEARKHKEVEVVEMENRATVEMKEARSMAWHDREM